ncbi:MAG: hypothetical protein R6V75_11725 [Bacteroidales bacterium]
MKRVVLLALIALIGIGFNTYGQENPDTSKVRIGKKQYTIIIDDDKEIRIITDENDKVITEDIRGRKPVRKHVRKMDGTWEGLEFGLSNFLNSDYQLELPAGADFMEVKMANSWGFNFNFAEKSLGIVRNYAGLVTGLGLGYNRYMFNNNMSLVKGVDGIGGVDSGYDLVKNRLSTWHLNLPLMVEVQIPVYGETNRLKLSAGVIGGLRIGSRQVQKYVASGDNQKIRTKDDFFLRDWRYGFTARAGYGDVSFFAEYYPQTLFKDNKGPEIFPVTFGIHIGS